MPILPRKDEFLVKGLEEIEPAFASFGGTMYAGMMPFESDPDRQGELMFWMFSSPRESDSLILWLNGGPGCSSFHGGLMMENSPVTIPSRSAGYCCGDPTESLRPNPNGWAHKTNVLYVEQPAGTGYSSGPEPVSEDEVSSDMYAFLVNFFTTFPELSTKKFFIFGESYAGMYVPSIAREIYRKNLRENSRKIHLQGIALGNGWINPKIQGKSVIDYAWWHGMIDTTTRRSLLRQWEYCLVGNVTNLPLHSFTTPDECGMTELVLLASGKGLLEGVDRGGPNVYDITTWDMYPGILDSDNPNTTNALFYNDLRVKKALHAPMDVTWRGCIPGASRRRRLTMLDDDRPLSTTPYLAELMDKANIRVLVYNGDRDLSVNGPGTELALDEMKEWSGHYYWKQARRGLWLDRHKKMAGYAKQYQHLTFLTVYNSGHLMPYNQPERGVDLLQRFLSNASFLDAEIPQIHFEESVSKPFFVEEQEQLNLYHSGSFSATLVSGCLLGIAIGLSIRQAWDWYARKGRRQYYERVDQP